MAASDPPKIEEQFGLPYAIINAIDLMPALRKLQLDLTGLDISQKYQFRSLLRDFGSGTTWRQLQHLRLSGDDLFSDELMEKAKSINSLELEVTVKTGWIQVLWPLEELPNLRKLCVDVNAQLVPGDMARFLEGIPGLSSELRQASNPWRSWRERPTRDKLRRIFRPRAM